MRLLRDLFNAIYTEQESCIFCGSERDLVRPYVCAYCLKRIEQPEPSFLDGHPVMSAVVYDARSRLPVLSLKFAGARWLARPMARCIAEAAGDLRADCITNIPLHPRRLEYRGYDQSELLARELADLAGLPYDGVLSRVRNTKQQSRLSRKKRVKNIKEAFVLSAPVGGLELILVDDVITTGSTILEAAGVLMKGGAKKVTLVSFGRAGQR